MGTQDHMNFSRSESRVTMCANVLVIASPDRAKAIDWASDPAAFPGLCVHECENADPLPLDAVGSASLVVLEIDPHSRGSMSRLHELKRAFPDLPVIAAISDSSLNLVRALLHEGVADVVSLPFRFEEVLETTAQVLASDRKRQDAQAALAPMIAVVRSTGGCGTTTVATHLAAQFVREETGVTVALADLDLQLGCAAEFLGATGRGSIVDLLEADKRLDEELLRSVARQSDSNVAVFAAPDEMLPLESVDTDKLLGTLELLRRQYSLVVLDLPSNWTNWALSAISSSSMVLMVVELSVASLRQAKRRLELFASVGIERDRIRIVANRVERRLFRTIDLEDVAQTLNYPVIGSLTLEEPLLSSSQDQGLLGWQLQRKSRFAQDIAGLAENLGEQLGVRPGNGGSGR